MPDSHTGGRWPLMHLRANPEACWDTMCGDQMPWIQHSDLVTLFKSKDFLLILLNHTALLIKTQLNQISLSLRSNYLSQFNWVVIITFQHGV